MFKFMALLIMGVQGLAIAQTPPLRLVEYYDPTCPHCHRMIKPLQELQQQFPSLHIEYRNTPVLPASARQLAVVNKTMRRQLQRNINTAWHYGIAGRLALPIFVFYPANSSLPAIVLRGEQPYRLLAAIVQQLHDNQYASTTIH